MNCLKFSACGFECDFVIIVNLFFKIFADEKRAPFYNLDKQPSGNDAYAWSRGHKDMLFESGLYQVLAGTVSQYPTPGSDNVKLISSHNDLK